MELSDAYFHIPICHSYCRYLRFVWVNIVYQFRALPFGLSTATLVFTNVIQAAIAHRHSQAIQISSFYLISAVFFLLCFPVEEVKCMPFPLPILVLVSVEINLLSLS
jgi:hypothetical protein